MRAMKDSGVEWIGEIPEAWCLVPNKRVMRKEKRICEQYGGEKVLSLTINGVIERDILNPKGKMPTTFDGYQHVYSGELILCLFDIDVTPCCVGRAYISGITSPAYSVFQLENDADLGYYFYYYKMVDNSKELLHLAKNLRHSFTEEQLGSLYVPKPNIIEQQKIANLLDAKCTEIDKVVEQTRATIEEYKKLKQAIITEAVTKGVRGPRPMKSSGVEWIGDIPAEWTVSTLGKVTSSMRNGYVGPTRDLFVDDGVRYIQSLHIKDGKIDLSKKAYFVRPEWAAERPKVSTGDVLIVQTGDIGQVGLVTEEYHECSCHALIIASPNKSDISSEYLAYFLRSTVGRELLLAHKTGALLPHLNSGKIRFAEVVHPNTIEEQKETTAYLDTKCAEIDRIIEKKEQLIDELGSYKKSLIYEYVTGKKEVTQK